MILHNANDNVVLRCMIISRKWVPTYQCLKWKLQLISQLCASMMWSSGNALILMWSQAYCWLDVCVCARVYVLKFKYGPGIALVLFKLCTNMEQVIRRISTNKLFTLNTIRKTIYSYGVNCRFRNIPNKAKETEKAHAKQCRWRKHKFLTNAYATITVHTCDVHTNAIRIVNRTFAHLHT